MAESGCLRDGKFNNLECNQFIKLGSSIDRHTDFMHGTADTIQDATGVTITQTNGAAGEAADDYTADAAYTLVANAISIYSGDASAAALVNLPPAETNTYCIMSITGDLDAANILTIQTNNFHDKFAKQTIPIIHSDNGGSDAAVTHHGVRTSGTRAAPTATELLYTPAATSTNFLGVNSEIHFYCNRAHRWMARVYGIAETTGATGALTVATAALA